MRSACPIAGVPAGTGDITLFNPPSSTDSRAIDVTAAITDVRAVLPGFGQRRRLDRDLHRRRACAATPGPARQVILPYFDVALRGGSDDRRQAGRPGRRSIFAAGSLHGWTRVQATVRVNRGAATLPANVREILTRPRKAGEAEAAIDPLADPAVRKAVANATFEHLIGFQLTKDQLKYNATR